MRAAGRIKGQQKVVTLQQTIFRQRRRMVRIGLWWGKTGQLRLKFPGSPYTFQIFALCLTDRLNPNPYRQFSVSRRSLVL